MKVFLVAYLLLALTACSSSRYSKPIFSSKYDCENGWYAASERLCFFENYGY